MKKVAPAPKSVAPKNKAIDFRVRQLPQAILDAALASGEFPYDKKLKRKRYERELRALQIELGKFMNWAKAKGERIVIVFEGRDAAGKGGAIQRLDRKSTRLNSSHIPLSRMPSSA